MTDRLPGKYKSELHTKPWFFSGKVPDIKYSYTVAGLTPSNYPIRPRSIIPGSKLDHQSNTLGYLNVDEKKQQDFKREFREYNFLRENEVLLTIEHCDNCEEHANTTRHDPAKYTYYAQSLKNAVLSRYSMVKILLKPVSKLDPESNKKRMGAFEVQVSTKVKGKLTVVSLHSKLASCKWPDISDVVSRLSTYLPTCQLFVTVFDESNQEKTLKSLKVQVRPKPVELEMQRPSSNYSSFRPRSAVTTRSAKNIRVSSTRKLSHKSLGKTRPPIVYEKFTDRDGMCLFDSIPLDVYEIEVVATKEIKGAIKVFNTFEEKLQNSSLNVYIGVKSLENCCVTVILNDGVLKTEVVGAKVTILKEAEMYYLTETHKGTYEISVPKGEYTLKAESGKYKDFATKISANQPEIIITQTLELKKVKEFSVIAYDALTGESLSGVLVELVINNHLSYEGMTKSGKHSFKIDETGLFNLKSRLRGYVKAKVSLVVGSSEISNIHIPLVPVSLDRPAMTISWCRCSDDIEIQGQTSTKPLNIHSPDVDGFSLTDLLKSHGYAVIIINPDQSFRLSLKGLTKDITNFSGFLMSGISVQYYSWRKQVATIKPVAGSGEWWDVGFYSSVHRDFVETNWITGFKIAFNEQCSEFLAVCRHVQRAEAISTAFLFGHGVAKTMSYGKDLFLSPEIFKKALQPIVSHEFLTSFTQFLSTTDGVSLSSLSLRYERYVGLGKNPIKKLEEFTNELQIDKQDEKTYKHLIEEGFNSPFPENWEVVYNENGDKIYRSLEGEILQEYPNVFLYRKKILDLKKMELKSSNKVPEIKAKVQQDRNSKDNSIVSKSSNRSRPKAKLNQTNSSGSSSDSNSIEIKNSKKEKSHDDKEEFLRSVNDQCEKLAALAIQNIEFFNQNRNYDNELQDQLMTKIDEYLDNFQKYLRDEGDQKTFEFFLHWNNKLIEIKGHLDHIAEQAASSGLKSKNQRKNSRSSKATSHAKNESSYSNYEEYD